MELLLHLQMELKKFTLKIFPLMLLINTDMSLTLLRNLVRNYRGHKLLHKLLIKQKPYGKLMRRRLLRHKKTSQKLNRQLFSPKTMLLNLNKQLLDRPHHRIDHVDKAACQWLEAKMLRLNIMLTASPIQP